DFHVTGVQTCALPIFPEGSFQSVRTTCRLAATFARRRSLGCHCGGRGFSCFWEAESGGRMGYVESRNRATSDPETRREVLAEIESRGIEDVLLWFTDVEGHLKSFA